ncbi:MAG: glycosyltransferase family 4 protein [Acidobacteriota bacterium]|nr:glycosyltransferase family 4 protein [Acidobacteriota bacterium]
MKIAFIGQKGVPATFGGVEYHVDELGRHLAALGHEVTIYVRSWYTPRRLKTHNGMRLVHLPTIRTKHLDAAVHSFTAAVHAAFNNFDIVHFHALGPSFFSFIPAMAGKTVVVTVHRLDWATRKWGPLARRLLKIAERVVVHVPRKTIVVSRDLQTYFRNKYRRETAHVSHGITLPQRESPNIIRQKYHLRGGDFILFMGRLTPEKRVDWLLEAYRRAVADRPASDRPRLVIAGGSSATDAHVRSLQEQADKIPGVVFTGYVRGKEKDELLSNAALFVLPSSLEGFPIVLIEARSHGLCCLASDIPPHREAIRDGEDGRLFHSGDLGDLSDKLADLLDKPETRKAMGAAALKALSVRPGWEDVARKTLSVYQAALPRA